MAKYGSGQAGLALVDGFSILGSLTEMSDDTAALQEDTTTLGAAWETHEAHGVKTSQFMQAGFYNDAEGDIHEALVDSNGVARVVCYAVNPNTNGLRFIGLSGAMQSRYKRTPGFKGFHKAAPTYEVSGQRDEGRILHALGAETADDDTEADSVDNGASSANGGVGYLQVTAVDLDGYDDIVVKIRDSADDITFADLITFAAATAHPHAERTTVAGTVDRYLATSWAFTGTGTSPEVSFFVGFARA